MAKKTERLVYDFIKNLSNQNFLPFAGFFSAPSGP
jgi:hypothetical protein